MRALADDGSGTIDELVVYFQAMLTRARITAATAGVLAADGDSVAAIRMIDDLQVSIRRDYFDVHNRLSALSRSPMDVSRWRRLLPGDAAGKAHRTVELLAGDLDKVIGGRLPEPDAIVELPVDVGLVHLVA